MVGILRFGVVGLLGCVGAIAVSIHPTFAQLTPDNTLGIERSQVIPINQNNDRIEGGAARGTNLFHSFQDFNVGVGRGIYFANPQGITNIFSRVTGSNSSNIFGKLGVLGNANLFLLNPNGIVFGKNASLDLQGSFLGTTANSLVFPNGVEFSATNPQAPPLLSINVPIGLQFGSQPGSITNQAVNELSVGSGSTLALMGGEIGLDGSSLSTENGQVKLGAVSTDTTVGLNVNGSSLGFNFPENFGRAPINLTNANIFATGENSAIELFGGKIALNGSSLFGNNSGSIIVDATQFNLDNDSSVLSVTSGAAKGGDIQIQANDAVTLANGSTILSASNAEATGAGGDVTINGGKITITGDGTVKNSGKISASTNGKGNGGNLTLNARESVNVNGGFISVSSRGAGNGGNLTVRATDAVNITDRSSIYSNSNAAGAGGDVTINGGKITITGDGTVENSGKFSIFSYGEGNGGNLTFNARESVNVNGGLILVSSEGAGNGGNLTVRATDAVNVTDRSSISSDSNAAGAGGDITINGGKITITGDGTVENSGKFSIFSYGEGNGG
ncbi:MAG: two-partner secretion domain-containing protein, partial [Nostoc sp.]